MLENYRMLSASKGFDPHDTASVVFLIVGLVCLLGGCALCWLTYHYMKNKPDYNRAQQMNWFSRWIYNNRLVIVMMTTIIVLLCGLLFVLMSCNIMIDLGNNYGD